MSASRILGHIAMAVPLTFLPILVEAQAINPTVIFQRDDIVLQNTDVYYTPYQPPGPSDTREQLCAIAEELRDPDGRPDHLYAWNYDPYTRGASFKATYGDTAVWMRLFHAGRRVDGTATNIVVGSHVTNDITQTGGYGDVTISALEDVDFRASGTVKLESGFHAKPGSFFHAYQEPDWGSGNCATAGDSGNALLFCDEFDASLPQWPVMNGYWGGADCDKDSNVTSNYSDAQAVDGKALRIVMRLDSCQCNHLEWRAFKTDTACIVTTGCQFREVLDISSCTASEHDTADFSTGSLMSCPWPFKSVTTQPWRPVSQSLPYGKYEMREKLPQGLFYHTNLYAEDLPNALNMGETYESDSTHIVPCIAYANQYGPFKGKFSKKDNDTVFRSGKARFSLVNSPRRIIIDGFPYAGSLSIPAGNSDTFFVIDNNTQLKGGIPDALFNADSVTFYYERRSENSVNALPWSLDATRRLLTAAYDIGGSGDTLRFTKTYQPTTVTLFPESDFPITINCHWDQSSGSIKLDDTLPSSYPSSDNVFNYTCEERRMYPQAAISNRSGEYHTYAFEFLPNEWRFLEDGAVIRRVPDRLIPTSDERHNFVRDFPRMLTPAILHFDIAGPIRRGARSSDAAYHRRVLDFMMRAGTQSEMLVDHIKIWGLPGHYSVPLFPY